MDYPFTSSAKEKKEGFAGQRLYFSPLTLRETIRRHPLGQGLYAAHTGWYPKARYHGIHRMEGIAESVLIFCTAGRGWFEVEGKRGVIEAGQVLLIPQNLPHEYGADTQDPWSIYWMHYCGNTSAAYNSRLCENGYILLAKPAEAVRMKGLFDESLGILAEGQTLNNLLLVSHVLRHIFGILLSLEKVAPHPSRPAGLDLTPALEHMQGHLDRKLGVDELAETVHLSPSRFSVVFRQRTGVTPVDYHIRLRMQVACHWLDATMLPVKEIAERCGYEDAYYFSRAFKRVIGLSPLAYRRSSKG